MWLSMNINWFEHGQMKKALLQRNTILLPKITSNLSQKKKAKRIQHKYMYYCPKLHFLELMLPFFFPTFGHLTSDLPTLPRKAS